MEDPYIQKNGTLKNKLGITEYEMLNEAEADIGFAKIINVDTVKTGEMNVDLLKKVHEHIFSDIFEWAGEYRTIPLYKAEKYVIPGLSIDYAKPKEIELLLMQTMQEFNSINWDKLELDDKVKQFTSKLIKLWKIHPFRDGNTRTVLSFGSIFAKEHGFPLDLSIILNRLSRKENAHDGTAYSVRDLFVYASLEEKDAPEPEHLERLIKRAIISENNKNIQNGKDI